MADQRRSSKKRMLPAPHPGRGTLRLAVVLAVLVGVNLYVFLWRGDTSIPAVMEQAAMAGHDGAAGQKAGAPPASVDGKRAVEPMPGVNGAAGGGDGGDGDDDGAGDAGEADDGQPVPEHAEEDGRLVTGEVKPGDSLGRILRRENMSPPEADEVIRALQGHMDFRKIRPGQTYRLRFDDSGRLVEFEFHLSRTVTIRAKRNDQGELVGSKVEASTEVRVREVGGRIDSSLYAAVKGSGEDTSLVAFFVDVFAYDINFYTETHQGDVFRMLVEKEYLGDEFLRYERVLAAEYRGREGTFQAFYWQEPGAKEGRYFDAEGRSVEKSLLKTPLKFARISSKFNPNRMHPILHTRRGHMGVDYAAPTGTPVWAAASGKIRFRGKSGGAGNMVILAHDGGLETVYMHLSKFRTGQKVGQMVEGKTVIGYVGTTGLSTGPHLHFGVKRNGSYVDPMKLEPTRRSGVPKKHRARFTADVGKLAKRLAGVAVPGSG